MSVGAGTDRSVHAAQERRLGTERSVPAISVGTSSWYVDILGIVEYQDEDRDRRITNYGRASWNWLLMGFCTTNGITAIRDTRALRKAASMLTLKEGIDLSLILARLDRDGLVRSECGGAPIRGSSQILPR